MRPDQSPTRGTIPSIRARLTVLVLCIVAPAAMIVAGLLLNGYRQGRAQLEASTIGTARALAIAVDQRLSGVQDAMEVLATSRSLRIGELALFRDRAVEVQVLQNLAIIGLLDGGLQRVLDTIAPYGEPVRPAAAAPFVKAVFTTGRPVTTDLFKGSLYGSQMFAIAVPVWQEGAVRYALVAGMAPGSIGEILAGQKLPPGWLAAVLDSSGRIVARSRDQARFVGEKPRQTLLERIRQAEEGSSEGVTLDQVPVLTVFSKAPMSRWTVIIGIPSEDLTRELRRSLAWLLAGTLTLLAGGIALAWRFSGLLVRSVESLKMAATQLGRREPVSVPRMAFAEAADLGLALAQASRDLRQAGTELEANELELSQAGNRLAGLVDSAMDGIITIDERQTILLFNRAAERIFGHSRQDMLGKSILILIPARFHGTHDGLVRSFGQTGVTARRMGGPSTLYGIRSQGEEFPVEASISQLDTPEGKLFTVVVRDVTERVRSQEDLARLASQSSALREQEKRRVARELHDDLAQTMTVVKIDLLSLRDTSAMSPTVFLAKVDRMIGLMDAGVAATRRIAADLRPLLLDDLGLPAALEWLVQNFTQQFGVECELEMSAGFDLAEPHATELFRIVQEALTNVGKHSGATQAFVKLEVGEQGVTLRVEDNGRGFQPDGPRSPQSLGLAGVRERVGLLRGQLTISSAAGRGTTFKVQIPLQRGTQ